MAETKTDALAVNGTAKTIGELLTRHMPEIAKVVPKHITPDRLLKVMINCIAKTPKLQQCTIASLVDSFRISAELGLEPGGALGHMYMVPFGNVCTPIIGYRGMIHLMRRSGELTTARAVVVHEGDLFEWEEGLAQSIIHRPSKAQDRTTRPIEHVYSVLRMRNGDMQADVMSKMEVDAVRARAPGKNADMWNNHYPEAAKKTVTRRNAKYGPMSAELADQLEREDGTIDGEVVRQEERAELDPGPALSVKAAVKARRLEMADLTTGQVEVGAPPDNVSLPTLDGGREAK